MSTPVAKSLSLTPRDAAILAFVYAYDGCVVDQLRRRFWPSFGARSACYNRVAHLINAGYLASRRLPSLTGQGSGKAFLTIGPRARSILAKLLRLSRTELRRATRAGSPLFIPHHLAIGEFRLAVELAAERLPHVSLAEWLGERELERAPIKVSDPASPSQRAIRLVPDGAFTLELQHGAEQAFLLELDAGTIPAGRLRERCRAYLLHLREQGDRTPILFVVPDARRQAAIAAWALAAAEALSADPTIFWLVTSARVSQDTVLTARIWQVVGVPAAQAFVPAPLSQAASRPPAPEPLAAGVAGSFLPIRP